MPRQGRHFLQIPGPTNVPDRVLRAMDMPTMDHRSPAFGELGLRVLGGMKSIFKCSGPVFIYPASGTGAWEAALVNTLSPGDHVLMYETGHFSTLWRSLATKVGLHPEFLQGDWRSGADAGAIEHRLRDDPGHEIKAVCVVHNETSTGATTPIDEVRKAIDAAGHPALLLVDTISSLASIDFRMDEWGVDVTVAGSQKGLMLPPGLSFNAVSEKALAAAKTCTSMKAPTGAWQEMAEGQTSRAFFPYTPATNLLLRAALKRSDMLLEEGLDNGIRPPRPARRGDPSGGARLGTGASVPRREGVQQFEFFNGGVDCPTATTPMLSARWSLRKLRHVPRQRPRARLAGQGVPDRPPRRLQRIDAGRYPLPGSRWGLELAGVAFRTIRAASRQSLDLSFGRRTAEEKHRVRARVAAE